MLKYFCPVCCIWKSLTNVLSIPYRECKSFLLFLKSVGGDYMSMSPICVQEFAEARRDCLNF